MTNGEYAEFVDDGGYEDPTLWLSDGWSWLQQNAIGAPLYWQRLSERWHGGYLSCRDYRQLYELAVAGGIEGSNPAGNDQ